MDGTAGSSMYLADRTDSVEETVDPRVQVELECLNAATDEINRLEVDLDEAKKHFRCLLDKSTEKVKEYTKQYGPHISNSLPYYQARLKVKETRRETEKMAAAFEKANSAHAAAKEMVFLAEEGLRADGRTFDHAWQEMLNHATMRVNEAEATKTTAEAEFKKMVQLNDIAEIRLQELQKSFKKSIFKSLPYFQLRIYYNEKLDEQKKKVKELEKLVSDTKIKYSDTLKNLEQISDEIHQSRKWRTSMRESENVTKRNSPHSDSSCPSVYNSAHSSQFISDVVFTQEKATPTSGSSMPDTDVWSETSDHEVGGDDSEQDSSLTGVPDTDSDTISHNSEPLFKDVSAICDEKAPNKMLNNKTDSNLFAESLDIGCEASHISEWTEIKLSSPCEQQFPKMEVRAFGRMAEDLDIPYAPLTEFETDSKGIDYCGDEDIDKQSPDVGYTSMPLSICLPVSKGSGTDSNQASISGKVNLRRQSLDVLWNNPTGEKMKEILSHGILKLNISAINERRNSESSTTTDHSKDIGADESGSNAISTFGLLFAKKSKPDCDKGGRDSQSSTPRKKLPTPSPLERTLSFLNQDGEACDTESLLGMDLLTEEQLYVLALDQDLTEQYEGVV